MTGFRDWPGFRLRTKWFCGLDSQGSVEYYFDNLSMIPEEKQFLVVDESSDQRVGVLDEAFMAEFGKPGTKFIIRGSPWIIQTVSEEKVHVRPIEDPTGAIPSWIGEEIPVPFKVSQEVGFDQSVCRGAISEGCLNRKNR